MEGTQQISNPNLREFKYQTVNIDITGGSAGPGQFAEFSAEFDLDKQYKKCVGVAFEIIPSAPGVFVDLLKIGRFEINNREIYSQDLPVKLFLNTSTVSPNDKFDKDINEKADGVKASIKLREFNSIGFVPYTVSVIFKLSNII